MRRRRASPYTPTSPRIRCSSEPKLPRQGRAKVRSYRHPSRPKKGRHRQQTIVLLQTQTSNFESPVTRLMASSWPLPSDLMRFKIQQAVPFLGARTGIPVWCEMDPWRSLKH